MGFTVTLRFVSGSLLEDTVLNNVTEIHWNYRGGMVAFESDVHKTGITYYTYSIAEFEAIATDTKKEVF